MAILSETVIYEALKIIQKNGGTMRGSEVSKIVGENALTRGVEGLARSIHEGYQNWRAGQNSNDLNIGIQEEYKPRPRMSKLKIRHFYRLPPSIS